MIRTLGPIGVSAMEKRHLNPETATRLGISTGRVIYAEENGQRRIERVDQEPDGNIICFPIIERGEIVGEKYRGPNKFFFQKPGSKQVFINGDALDDPSLEDGSNPLVIVEGELDMISAIDVGFPLSVSVPAGAPTPPKEGRSATDEPTDDSTGKYEFLFHRRERLKKIKRFIIAVDNDRPGQHLADELVRRLSAARCSFVTYPDGCKDLNDVLMQHGPEAARAVLENARPYPLKGVYSLKDYPERPPIETFSTGWETVDELYKPFAPSFTLVTGIPGSGKSSWMAHLCVNLATMHGWKTAVFSPEMPTVPQLRDTFRAIVANSSVETMSRQHLAKADAWINANLFFIDHDVIDDSDSDLSLEWLIDRVYDALMRYGIRVFVLDGWNEVEHCRARGENETEYTNRAVRTLRKFGKRHGIAIFIVAHPTKDVGKDGKSRVPTPYDVAGGAVWFNKPDHIIVVDRPNADSDLTDIWIKKVRFKGTGRKGNVVLRFDLDSNSYEMLGPVSNHYAGGGQ